MPKSHNVSDLRICEKQKRIKTIFPTDNYTRSSFCFTFTRHWFLIHNFLWAKFFHFWSLSQFIWSTQRLAITFLTIYYTDKKLPLEAFGIKLHRYNIIAKKRGTQKLKTFCYCPYFFSSSPLISQCKSRWTNLRRNVEWEKFIVVAQ